MKPIYFLLAISMVACNQNKTEKSVLTTSKTRTQPSREVTLSDSALLISASGDEKQINKAISLLDEAIKIKPDYFVAHINRLSLLCKVKNYQEALKEVIRLEKMDPNNQETIFFHGLIEEKLGNHANAQSIYKQSFQIIDKNFHDMDSDNKMFQFVRMNRARNLYFINEEAGKQEFKKINSEYSENQTVIDYLSKSRSQLLQSLLDGR